MKNTGTFTVTTPTDREIVLTRIFDAPRAVVFEAWTKAEHVANWWDPSGVPLSVCEIDLRPNGAFRWVNSGSRNGTLFYRHIQRNHSSRTARVRGADNSVAPGPGRNAHL